MCESTGVDEWGGAIDWDLEIIGVALISGTLVTALVWDGFPQKIVIFLFVVLGKETRASHMLGLCSTTELHP